METNKLKPYLFWIICGVLLLIELVYFGFFLSPTPPQREQGVNPPANAQTAKRNVERSLKKLDNLKVRAQKTIKSPPQFEVMDPAEAERLTAYIVSKEWESGLQREIDKRKAGLKAIQAELSHRSQSMHVPVSGQTDPVAWYADYQSASAALVQYLVEERVIEQPTSRSQNLSGYDAYRSDRELRGVVDLVTADGNEQQFDNPTRREEVRQEFRIIDAVARSLAQVEAAALPHPFAAPYEEVPPPVPTKLSIVSLVVTPGAKADGVNTFTVSVELKGTPTVLLEASRRLDALVNPIGVRLSSTWTRLDFGVRGKHGEADVPMSYRADLLVLDFHNPALSGK